MTTTKQKWIVEFDADVAPGKNGDLIDIIVDGDVVIQANKDGIHQWWYGSPHTLLAWKVLKKEYVVEEK